MAPGAALCVPPVHDHAGPAAVDLERAGPVRRLLVTGARGVACGKGSEA